MIVNGAVLTEVKKVFSTAFNKAFDVVSPSPIREFVTEAEHDGQTISFKWPGTIPTMKALLGEGEFHKMSAFEWSISDAEWQVGIEIERKDIEDDKLNLYRPTIDGMGGEAARFRDEKIFTALNAGFTTTGYDGQFFFDTDHSDEGQASQSNKATAALAEASLRTGIDAFEKLVDTKGRPLNLKATTLFCGVASRWTAIDLLEQARQANGEDNVMKGMLRLIVSPYITGNKWYLTDSSKKLGIIFAKRYARPATEMQTNPESDVVFEKGVYRFQARDRFNVGYGLWQYWYGSDGTT